MGNLKDKLNIIQISSVIIPLILSVLFVKTKNFMFLPAVVVLLFLIVGLCPLFKKRENLWMFILSGVALLPCNIYVSYLFVYKTLFYTAYVILDLISYIVTIFILFCIEEIVLAFITRLIWKKQYRWPAIDPDDE